LQKIFVGGTVADLRCCDDGIVYVMRILETDGNMWEEGLWSIGGNII